MTQIYTSTANEFLHSELSISCNIVSDKTLQFHCANETALRTSNSWYSTYCLVFQTACAQLLCIKAIQIILQNLAEHFVTSELHVTECSFKIIFVNVYSVKRNWKDRFPGIIYAIKTMNSRIGTNIRKRLVAKRRTSKTFGLEGWWTACCSGTS